MCRFMALASTITYTRREEADGSELLEELSQATGGLHFVVGDAGAELRDTRQRSVPRFMTNTFWAMRLRWAPKESGTPYRCVSWGRNIGRVYSRMHAGAITLAEQENTRRRRFARRS